MLLIDLLTIASLVLMLAAWFTPSMPRRHSVLWVSAGAALVIAAVGLLDARWQLAAGGVVALIVLATLAIMTARGKTLSNKVPWISGVLFAALSIVAALMIHWFPVSPLPEPVGPYKVGVTDFVLVDESRTGVFTDEGKPRRLLVRAWYPAESVDGIEPRFYFDAHESEHTSAVLSRNLGLPPFALTHLEHVRTHSHPDAPILSSGDLLPTVLYSHGYASYIGQNTALMEHLASKGYAVFSISHPGSGATLRFPDGEVFETDDHYDPTGAALYADEKLMDLSLEVLRATTPQEAYDTLNALDGYSLEIERPMYMIPPPIWKADVLFVAAALEAGDVPDSVRPLIERIDPRHRAHAGMSFGSSTAGASCYADPECDAAVLIDGGDFHDMEGKSIHAPFVVYNSDLRLVLEMLGAERTDYVPHAMTDMRYERLELAGLRDDTYFLMQTDITHIGVSDFAPYMNGPLGDLAFGSADDDRHLALLNEAVGQFLDRHMLGQQIDYPDRVVEEFEGMILERDLSVVRDWWVETNPRDRTVGVVLTTEFGDIELQLYPERAPESVANFLQYVDEGHFDGGAFYRTVRPDNQASRPGLAPVEIVQGGIMHDLIVGADMETITAWSPPVPPIAHEPDGDTGLVNRKGSIAYGRLAPGTAASEFFINLTDNPGYNAGSDVGDGLGYAVFGQAVKGMDVLRKIQLAPLAPSTDIPIIGEQLLADPVTFAAVRKTPDSP